MGKLQGQLCTGTARKVEKTSKFVEVMGNHSALYEGGDLLLIEEPTSVSCNHNGNGHLVNLR